MTTLYNNVPHFCAYAVGGQIITVYDEQCKQCKTKENE